MQGEKGWELKLKRREEQNIIFFEQGGYSTKFLFIKAISGIMCEIIWGHDIGAREFN